MNNKVSQKILITGIIVLLQAIWLFADYALNTVTLDHAPKLRLPCTYDNQIKAYIPVPLSPKTIGQSITWNPNSILDELIDKKETISNSWSNSGRINLRILDETGADITSQYPNGVPRVSVLPLPDPGERPLATGTLFYSYNDNSVDPHLSPINKTNIYWRHESNKNGDLILSHLEKDVTDKASSPSRSLPELEYTENDSFPNSWIKELTLKRNGDQFKPELVFFIPCDYRVLNPLLKKAEELYRAWVASYHDSDMSEHLKFELFVAAHRHQLIPIQLYVNGVPIDEAIQKIKETVPPFDFSGKKN